MEKQLTIFIRLEAPAEGNVFGFIEKLRVFLDEAATLGEIKCDFSTLNSNSFDMRR